ncbi:MAG: ATP synthase F0 subunit B [Oscillospiraceae bacterium]|nr:ATP synthase F0 subunit B [Oscillospiraceae bacterium]
MDLISLTTSIPPFGIDFNTLISAAANLVNVGILGAVLAFLLYRPVRNVLHKRTERIKKQLQQADDEMARAVELRKTYEQKMEDVEKEKEEILTDARKNAAEAGKRLISEAKIEADAARERATANIEMEWERAETQMRTAIIDVSSMMAQKFVSVSIDKETQDNLFDDAVSNLEGMRWRD